MADEPTVTSGGDEGAEITPGATIGRFVVTGSLGAGGMGVVVAAHDPELDRKVAIKLLRSDSWKGDEGRERLRREAQAMAKVSHPNVATVFEVGSVGETLFVAMELVDGPTLRGWLQMRPRDWREILRQFAAAGRGLEAVHAAGLVHRDFKPDNVLCGSDGRPRVSDFGIVGSGQTKGLVPGPLTLSHAGTPGYMAPEQLRGEVCDARSDQFSFCVALYQALYGERPFPEDAPEDARHAPSLRPKKSQVPARLFEVLARGLQRDPAARWPNLDALLAELAYDPRVRWRRAGLAAALILLAGAGGFGLWRMRAASCGDARPRLAGIWDAGAREAVHRAFAGSQVAFAEDSFQRAAAQIDQWTQGWVAMHEEACRATRVEGRQSDALMDLRETCLDQRRGTLAALVKLWSGGVDSRAVERAIDAAGALPSLSECADAKALTERTPLPRDPAVVAKIAKVRDHLDRVYALIASGRFKEAEPEGLAARAEADATGWPEVRAVSAYRMGAIYSRTLDVKAEAALSEASSLAQQARDDRLAALTLIELVMALAGSLRAPDRALLAASLAEGAVERAGSDELRGRLELARAGAYLTQAKYDDARKQLERARDHLKALGPEDPAVREIPSRLARIAAETGDYALARKLYHQDLETRTAILGPDHPELGAALQNYAIMLESATDYPAAIDAYRRSISIMEKAYGPDSARVGGFLGNLANSEWSIGLLDQAAHDYERAIALGVKARGADNADIAATYGNLSGIRVQQGRLDEGMELAERSLRLQAKALGADHPNLAFPEDEIGDVLKARGDLAGAVAHYQRAWDLRKKPLGPAHIFVLGDQLNIANVRCRQKRYAEGIATTRALLPLVVKAIGPDQNYVGQVHADLGRCLADAGQLAEGKEELARGLAISQKSPQPPGVIASIHFQQARVEYLSGKRADGLAAARAAEKELIAAAWSQNDIAEAKHWLAAHP